MTVLRTDRLTLRPAQMDDLPDIHAILSDPVAMRYWSSLPHATLEQSREWLANMVGAPADQSCDFVIEFEGRVVGKAGCWRLPAVGYILHPQVWGQGIAFEAMSAILPHVFSRHPVQTLTADVDPRNTGSLALLAKLGFVETHRAEATWRIGDEVCDSVYLALNRPA